IFREDEAVDWAVPRVDLVFIADAVLETFLLSSGSLGQSPITRPPGDGSQPERTVSALLTLLDLHSGATSMPRFLRRPSARVSRVPRPSRVRWRAALESLGGRVAPAGNLLVTTAGAAAQQFFEEFTPTGALVRAVTVPAPPGTSGDTARGIVQ